MPGAGSPVAHVGRVLVELALLRTQESPLAELGQKRPVAQLVLVQLARSGARLRRPPAKGPNVMQLLAQPRALVGGSDAVSGTYLKPGSGRQKERPVAELELGERSPLARLILVRLRHEH